MQRLQCKGHAAPVCAADAIYVEDSKILVASSASDSTVRLWLCAGSGDGRRLDYLQWDHLEFTCCKVQPHAVAHPAAFGTQHMTHSVWIQIYQEL